MHSESACYCFGRGANRYVATDGQLVGSISSSNYDILDDLCLSDLIVHLLQAVSDAVFRKLCSA